MFAIGMPEVGLILVIALVVFGPGKLPDVGKALGKGIQEFRQATSLDPQPPAPRSAAPQEQAGNSSSQAVNTDSADSAELKK